MKPRQVIHVVAAPPLLVLTGLLAISLVAASGGGALPPTPISDVPERALDAFRHVDGWCPGLRWELVAGIGWVESRHGTTRGAAINPQTGEARPWIFGPPLDGSEGVRRLAVGQWIGWWGLPGPWQQAVGPMQFLPAIFDAWAIDRDEDGVTSPHDIDDAVATAANYLCGRDEAITDEREALLRYNRSESYVLEVLAYANSVSASTSSSGSMLCPVAGHTSFTDTWLAPRSGGRLHKGVDMFAAYGTPVVAPVAGIAEQSKSTLGGLGFRLWGDDGNFYYGAHFASLGHSWGHVERGTLLGYVGTTGNATGTAPHLHFEIHPDRLRGDPASPVNPTPAVKEACADARAGHAFISDD